MNKIVIFSVIILSCFLFVNCLSYSGYSSSKPNNISLLNGAIIIAQDNSKTYLGTICNSYNSDSIFNEYGNYGSPYSLTSIWNQNSQYGSPYSILSAFNEYTQTPPIIIKNNTIIGYVTTNRYKQGAISPYYLLQIKNNF
jgi:hypothetical protein